MLLSHFLAQGGLLAMFAYGCVCAMFWGLKFHLEAIFLGLKFSKKELPISFFLGGGGGKISAQLCNTSKIVPCYQIYD